MHTPATGYLLAFAAISLGMNGVLPAEDEAPPSETKAAAVDVRALLKAGQAAGRLPDDMVIRVRACLGELRETNRADSPPQSRLESWEFTSQHVHRVSLDGVDPPRGRRVDSRPFDSAKLCQELLDGKAIEIQRKQGTGPEVVLAGSPYRRGWRSIEILRKGATVLTLEEVDGPGFVAYRETDARVFGALYERLANQARTSFAPK